MVSENVRSIKPSIELERFFDTIYGDGTGWVYTATKEYGTNNWEQYYFQWPQEKSDLINHVNSHSDIRDVYYSASLFSEASGRKEHFASARVLWVDFDGNAPASPPSDVPPPSIKVRSSSPGREHWYWILDAQINSLELFEDLSQRLAYHLDADRGCWNANRVLRPPKTKHHKSGLTVELLRLDTRPLDLLAFAQVPQLGIQPASVENIGNIPAPLKVIARYPFSDEEIDFFSLKEVARTEGKGRSAALAKLGHICIERGLTNAEALAMLISADNRWGKFKERGPEKQRENLINIINYCRSKHPVDPVSTALESEFRVYSWDEFMAADVQIDWLIPGLLHKKGLMCIAGPPQVGKSQLAFRLAEKMAKGKPFLGWSVDRPMRVVFFSLEMYHEEVLYLFNSMQMQDEEYKLRDNFFIMPVGSSLSLTSQRGRDIINKICADFEPDMVWIDSLGVALNDDIESTKLVLNTMDYINKEIRGTHNAAVGFIHHVRKAQPGNKKPNKLSDLFGNQYIGSTLTTGISLWPSADAIEVSCAKMRLSPNFKTFRMKRTPDIDFVRLADSPIITSTEAVFDDTDPIGLI